MDCKFLSNGIAIQYHNFLKPCCEWRQDEQWVQNHNIKKVDIVNWHQHKDLVDARELLARDEWPANCESCKQTESQGRQDSMRLNGQSAYGSFGPNDLTLEIRPGSVCNFACQTCWAPASSRVEHYYQQAQIINPFKDLVKNKFDGFDFLLPVVDRLKTIVVLGGEPFYDPNCLEFLKWSNQHTKAEMLVFTNGSVLDLELIQGFKQKFTLVFSLDAIGKPAEYIRFGTKWQEVINNFNSVRKLANVEVRVNITTSIYNFYYFADIVDMLLADWPAVVTFGIAVENMFTEAVIPTEQRVKIIARLELILNKVNTANIESGQKSNTINAITSIINNLKTVPYNKEFHDQFKEFVSKMDAVKKINLIDHCPEIADILL
jgi:sulfatase maturation enzyme AslB (radical SAM superfamily)